MYYAHAHIQAHKLTGREVVRKS